jgi:hypothetical protein
MYFELWSQLLFFSLSNEDSYIKLCNKKENITYAPEYNKTNDKKTKDI